MTFFIPTYEYANGNHTLTISGYFTDADGNPACWMYTFSAAFKNRLYLASIPERYKRDEPYRVKGFFDEGTITLSTDPNDAMTFDSGCVDYSTVIHQTRTAMLSICFANNGTTESQEGPLNEKINIADIDPNSYRAVIIAPCSDVNRGIEDPDLPNNRFLTAIRDTLDMRGIPYVELIEKEANWDNIRLALTSPTMNYVFWVSHGNSYVGRVVDEATGTVIEEGIQRTSLICWDDIPWGRDKHCSVFSWLMSDQNVLSTIEVPALPNDIDARGHSMASLRLWKSKTIKEFWAITCNSAVKWEKENWNDMSMAVGTYGYLDAAGHPTHVYFGNQIEIMPGGARNFLIGYPSALSKVIRRHGTASFQTAITTHDLTEPEMGALWGKDFIQSGYGDNVVRWWPHDIELWRVIFQ